MGIVMGALAQDIGPNKVDAGGMQESVLDIGRRRPHALLANNNGKEHDERNKNKYNR
jgi:hypothetical protein